MDAAHPEPPSSNPDRPVRRIIGLIAAPLIRLTVLLISTIAGASLFDLVNNSVPGGVVTSRGSGMSQILLDVAPDGRMVTASARTDPNDPLQLTNTLILQVRGAATQTSPFPSLSWWPRSVSGTTTLTLLGADALPANAAPPPLSDLREWGRILEASPDSIDNGAWYRSVGRTLIASADRNERPLFTRPRLAVASVLWVLVESVLFIRRRSARAPVPNPLPHPETLG